MQHYRGGRRCNRASTWRIKLAQEEAAHHHEHAEGGDREALQQRACPSRYAGTATWPLTQGEPSLGR